MSGHDDAEEEHRYKPAYNTHQKIPTIAKFREEKEARKAGAKDFGGNAIGDEIDPNAGQKSSHGEEQQNGGALGQTKGEQQQQDAGVQGGTQEDDPVADEAQPAIDTSEAGAVATDPKQRRKQLKKGKEERAEREVTDPVTHLPVKIHDLTSDALKEVPENNEPFGSTALTATGLANKKKSIEQLSKEYMELQKGYDSMQSLFPPPNFDTVKKELVSVYQLGVYIVMVGMCIIVILILQLWKGFETERFAKLTAATKDRPWLSSCIMWLIIICGTLGLSVALTHAVKNWISKRADTIWEENLWDASRKSERKQARGHETETVAWFNSLLESVWPLINPDLFTSLADTLEDVMQASLPRMVQMVSVDDIGQGSESIRILGIRWLPTGAAARSVSQDGKLKDDVGHSNDRKVPGEGETEDDGGGDKDDETQQQDEGSQQQLAEGMEAEEGDFVNLEVAFSYRARSNKKFLSMKDRAKDMHLYVAFYLPGNIKVPVWVDLRGIVGTMRMRLQLCPDPPFFSLCTLTFLGQPKVDISCTPLSRHALNIMDVPLISNFVQSAVDAAMAEYVAPKSLNLDLKDMLAGNDFKKDTNARGVLVVNIKRGYDFKKGDQGIPLVKDGSSDPYVSVGWAKFGKPVWSTRLLLDEMEPWWDETAYVLVTSEELNVHERLRLQLWDSDRFTADDDLGRIEVDLKQLMKNDQSDGKMWKRTDGFRALQAGETMPGKLEWSVGYFSKTPIQPEQLKQQTYDPEVHNMDELKQKVDRICDRKLREADIKKGRHKHDADELDQQRSQELKEHEDAMIICTPPPECYPSGIFSIQIQQITGLELEKISKTQQDKQGEVNDEEEEGEGLPSAYCTVIINHSKVFKTRTKPKNAKPFYNAGTERYIADWRNTEVYVSVRDARVKEDDALLGIVHLPLGEVFAERSQINGFYPLTGGIGYGRVRLSMLWRSIQLQAASEAIGWQYGTVEVQPSVSTTDLPDDLKALKLKFHTDLSSAKMYASKGGEGWRPRKDRSLKLAVRKRYSSCLAIQFRHHAMFHDNTAAFAVFWLKDIPDEVEREVTVPVWKGDFERATKCTLPECGEKVGSLEIKLTFWDGLGSAHSRLASKDPNLQDIIEVLDTGQSPGMLQQFPWLKLHWSWSTKTDNYPARDNLEEMKNENAAGVVDGNATDSSDDGDSSDDKSGPQIEGAKTDSKQNPIKRVKEYKDHEKSLNRRNRGIMQWKVRKFSFQYH